MVPQTHTVLFFRGIHQTVVQDSCLWLHVCSKMLSRISFYFEIVSFVLVINKGCYGREGVRWGTLSSFSFSLSFSIGIFIKVKSLKIAFSISSFVLVASSVRWISLWCSSSRAHLGFLFSHCVILLFALAIPPVVRQVLFQDFVLVMAVLASSFRLSFMIINRAPRIHSFHVLDVLPVSTAQFYLIIWRAIVRLDWFLEITREGKLRK